MRITWCKIYNEKLLITLNFSMGVLRNIVGAFKIYLNLESNSKCTHPFAK